MKSIAFIGSVGIPNCYGGFESFLECVAPVMAETGYQVYVTCDYNQYQDRAPTFRGVHRIFLKTPANGVSSILHDLFAFFAVVRKVDAIVVLGVSAGPFFPLMRLCSSFLKKKLLVNVDGLEWRRTKYSKKIRSFLRVFDFLAQFSATRVIYDNLALRPFIFERCREKAVCISYSGDHVLRLPEFAVGNVLSALTVCRIEPENNLEMLIQGALLSSIDRYVVIGNWNASEFGAKLRNKYIGHTKLSLLDPIYEARKIAKQRESCSIYLHGHSVGGTNPSLVEMLFYDCSVFCFDCAFNRETAGDLAKYFGNSSDLSAGIDAELKVLRETDKPIKKFSYPERYTVASIVEQYLSAIRGDALFPVQPSNSA